MGWAFRKDRLIELGEMEKLNGVIVDPDQGVSGEKDDARSKGEKVE